MNTFLKPKLAIIGAGKMTAKRHLPALLKLQESGLCSLVGICDINSEAAERLQNQFKIPKMYTDATAAVLDEEVEAVCIFGPADVHYKYGLLALQNGKHIFVEKPPAPSSVKLNEMIEAAVQNSKVAAVGFNRRFQKGVTTIQQELPADSIELIEAFFHKPFADMSVQFGLPSWLWINGIHALDTICYLMNERPSTLYVLKKDREHKTADVVSVVLGWSDGRQAILSSHNSSGTRMERYVAHGLGTTVIAQEGLITVERDNRTRDEYAAIADSAGGLVEEFEAFIEAISNDNTPVHDIKSTYTTIRLLELIEDGYCGVIDWSASPVITKEAEVEESELVASKVRNTKVPAKPTILVLNPRIVSHATSALAGSFGLISDSDFSNLSVEEKSNVIAIVTGGSGSVRPNEMHFSTLPNLSLLAVVGASVKQWGGDIASVNGIAIVNTADVYADPVAEFIILQILAGLRKVSIYDQVLKSGGWGISTVSTKQKIVKNIKTIFKLPVINKLVPILKSSLAKVKNVSAAQPQQGKPTRTLRHLTVTIYGFGEITKKLIPLLKQHGASVVVVSEYVTPQLEAEFGIRQVKEAEALRSDVVVMNRGVSPRTQKSFGRSQIMSLKSGAVFVNAARAELVDNRALVERLQKGDIFACIDVFDNEPLSPKDKIRTLKNVLLTPHIAGSINHVDGLEELAVQGLMIKLKKFLIEGDETELLDTKRLQNMT